MASTASAQTGPPVDEESTTAYIEQTVQDADEYWTNWLAGQGLEVKHALFKIVQNGELYVSECSESGTPANAPSAFYCKADVERDGVAYEGVLVLPVDTMLKMRQGSLNNQPSEKAGDFTVATVVTHEMGHWVQDVLVSQKARQPANPGKDVELMADCFSGVWAGAKYNEGRLTAQDFDAAVDSRARFGDEEFTDPNHHGTSGERVTAWATGYFGLKKNPTVDPMNCIDAYWR
ncbi:hypothetical protein GCM10010343_11440 [Streptomyces avidinii]|nr:hypothetical protein GCM10010343_11440 [Streptomyces avidinii]